ncbi:MAG TPA: hypothetical protein PKY59_17450 [Pyrinomonadaceae bacterium]|nr:hypothetical protein [Pyrinomonadaceae bacterium]
METGHSKNVANFETVIIVLTALGTVYNPVQALIMLTALNTKLVKAKAALVTVADTRADRKVKVDTVEKGFAGFYAYAVNLKRAADVSVNDAAFTADLQSIVNKFSSKGRDTGLPDDPATPDIDESRTARSTAERSRDKQLAHLADLIALLETKTDAYQSNDVEYTIEGAKDFLAARTAENNAAKTAHIVEDNAEAARDEVLYHPETGVLKLVKLIKTELARKPGKESPAYQQIAATEFFKP